MFLESRIFWFLLYLIWRKPVKMDAQEGTPSSRVYPRVSVSGWRGKNKKLLQKESKSKHSLFPGHFGCCSNKELPMGWFRKLCQMLRWDVDQIQSKMHFNRTHRSTTLVKISFKVFLKFYLFTFRYSRIQLYM